MAEFDGVPEEYQSAINKIVGERVKRANAAKDAEWGALLSSERETVAKLKPLAESAEKYRVDFERLTTRQARDKAYPATLAGEDKAPIRERLERLYDAEPADDTGARPEFSAWLAADPLASAIVGAPLAAPQPGGGGQGTVQQPAGAAALKPGGTPAIAAGAGNPAPAGPKLTPQQHKAAHSALIASGDVKGAAAYVTANMVPKA